MPPGTQTTRSKDKSDKADKTDKPITSAIKDLKTSVAAVLQHLETLDTTENLLRKVKELTDQLAEANKKVEEVQEEQKQEKAARQAMMKDFEERVLDWNKEENALKRQIEQLQRKCDENSRSRAEERDEKLNEYKRKLRAMDKDLQREKNKTVGLESQLRDSNEALEDLRGDFPIVPLKPDFFMKFEDLEASLYALTERFFKGPLQSFDQGLRHFSHFFQPMLLSYANDHTVPCARMAQSFIADRLAKDIFKPMCIASPIGPMDMGDALQRTGSEPRQKAILRSLLFKAFHAEEERQQKEKIKSVTSDLVLGLKEMLSPDGNNAFKEELTSYLESAADIWTQVKKGSDWVTASSNWHIHPQAWKIIRGESNKAVAVQEPVNPEMVIFPQIYIDGNDSKYYSGSLWASDSGPVEEKRNAQSPHARRASASRSSKSSPVAEASSEPGVTASRSLASRDRVSEMGRKVFSDSEGQRRCKSTC
ncbi:hypothetical protein BDQ94DRAFT_168766 [Aspergillus welwitschiae]|uniref:Uncharacterized protein n=1 Tax=Aspergillus welwitschiae TaxID=1341132 RepID=A0A3F3Q7C8_9EURO|nr:hypothetical protein BDQ94DRAFT_168766 [Aspergillus welwitschiae]RDH35091.1 hypothetical protein BDQ94DRAFT_168766 [Aspergillus welwitschiae]